MLEMKTEGGTIRLLYNADGPVERVLFGEASPGECPPLISIAPVGLGEAVEEVAALAGVPNGTILEALTTSQASDAAEDIWPFRVSYSNGLLERRPARQAAFNRAAEMGAELGLYAEVMDERTGEILANFDAGMRTYPLYPCDDPSMLTTGNPMWDDFHPEDNLEPTVYLD